LGGPGSVSHIGTVVSIAVSIAVLIAVFQLLFRLPLPFFVKENLELNYAELCPESSVVAIWIVVAVSIDIDMAVRCQMANLTSLESSYKLYTTLIYMPIQCYMSFEPGKVA